MGIQMEKSGKKLLNMATLLYLQRWTLDLKLQNLGWGALSGLAPHSPNIRKLVWGALRDALSKESPKFLTRFSTLKPLDSIGFFPNHLDSKTKPKLCKTLLKNNLKCHAINSRTAPKHNNEDSNKISNKIQQVLKSPSLKNTNTLNAA